MGTCKLWVRHFSCENNPRAAGIRFALISLTPRQNPLQNALQSYASTNTPEIHQNTLQIKKL